MGKSKIPAQVLKANTNKVNNITEETLSSVFEFALDPKNSAPVFKAERSKDWVPFTTVTKNAVGEECIVQYPDKLIELSTNSALHGAIIKSKTDQVAGLGFVWDEADASTNGTALAMSEFMSHIGGEDDANELLGKMACDLELFEGIALKITWTTDWSTIASVKHIDFSKVRAEKADEEGCVNGYYYSWDWANQQATREYFPAFNSKGATDSKAAYADAIAKLKEGNAKTYEALMQKENRYSQIFVYKPYRPGYFYYPLPSYVGAMSAIETDILCDQYGIASFNNGLTASILITVFGINTPEQQNKEAKKLLKMHTGAASTGKPMIVFAKNGEAAMKVDSISNKKEDQVFININENTMQKILSGHRVTDPLLVGIKTEGQLGAGEELKTAIEFWNTTVIRPHQMVITKIMNKVLDINGLPTVSIDPLVLYSTEEVTADTNTGAAAGNNNEIK